MISDKDLEKIKTAFSTREELKEVEMKIDAALELLAGNAAALKSIQEELTIKTYRTDQVEDHEERITKMEKRLNLPTTS